MTTPLFPSVIAWNVLDGGTDAQDGNAYPGPALQDYAAAVVGAAQSALISGNLFCIPGNDPSTSFRDVSGNSATAVPDAGNSGPYATAGYMATVAATNGGITIANASLPINLSTDSLCLAFVLKKAVPSGFEAILALSGGVGASQNGFYLSHRMTTGALKIVPTVAGAIVNAQADSTLAFSDGTPQDRHCVVTYDATTGVFSIYRDGVLSNAFTGTPMTGGNAFPNSVLNKEYRVGGTSGGATIVSVVTATYGHQLYVRTGALPTNIGQIASFLANSPRNPLPIGMWSQ